MQIPLGGIAWGPPAHSLQLLLGLYLVVCPRAWPLPPLLCAPWGLLQARPVSTDHREMQGRMRLRARDTVRVLVCIESLCHRHA